MIKLKDAFFFIPLKINVPGYDDISYNVIKKFFSSLCELLYLISQLKRVFSRRFNNNSGHSDL